VCHTPKYFPPLCFNARVKDIVPFGIGHPSAGVPRLPSIIDRRGHPPIDPGLQSGVRTRNENKTVSTVFPVAWSWNNRSGRNNGTWRCRLSAFSGAWMLEFGISFPKSTPPDPRPINQADQAPNQPFSRLIKANKTFFERKIPTLILANPPLHCPFTQHAIRNTYPHRLTSVNIGEHRLSLPSRGNLGMRPDHCPLE
jgi:hypothetical protein